MEFLTLKLSDKTPIASVEMNGERAKAIFSQRWPEVYRRIELAVEQEMNVNADISDDFPDIEMMDGTAEIQSIEYGADHAGHPHATYLVRCRGVGSGFYMHVEVIFGVRADGESIHVEQTHVGVG